MSGDAGQTHTANPSRQIYTVLPPPADYMRHSEKSFPLPNSENRNSAEDPSGKLIVILQLWSHALHHKTRRDLQHEVPPSLLCLGVMLSDRLCHTCWGKWTMIISCVLELKRTWNAVHMLFEPWVILSSLWSIKWVVCQNKDVYLS